MGTNKKWRVLIGGMTGAMLLSGMTATSFAEDINPPDDSSLQLIAEVDLSADSNEVSDGDISSGTESGAEEGTVALTVEGSSEEYSGEMPGSTGQAEEGEIVASEEDALSDAEDGSITGSEDENVLNDGGSSDLFADGLFEEVDENDESIQEDAFLSAAAESGSLTQDQMKSAQVITEDQLGSVITAEGVSQRNKKLFKFTPSVTQVFRLYCADDEETANTIEPDMSLYTAGVRDRETMDVLEDAYFIESAGVLTAGTDYYFEVSAWSVGNVQFVIEPRGEQYIGVYGVTDMEVDCVGSPVYFDEPEIIAAGTLAGKEYSFSWYRKTDSGYVSEPVEINVKGVCITAPIYSDTEFRCEIHVGNYVETKDFTATINRLSDTQLAECITLTETDFGTERTDSLNEYVVYRFRPQADMTIRYSLKESADYDYCQLYEGTDRKAVRFDTYLYEENYEHYIKNLKADTDYYLKIERDGTGGNSGSFNVSLMISLDDEIYCSEKYFYTEYGTSTEIYTNVLGAWSGSDALSWQWYEKVGEDDYRRIEGAVNSTYNTGTITRDAEYLCEASCGDKKGSAEVYVGCTLADDKLYAYECAGAENLIVNNEIKIQNTEDMHIAGGSRDGRLFRFTPSTTGRHTLRIDGITPECTFVNLGFFDGLNRISTYELEDEEVDYLETTIDLQAGKTYYLLMEMRWNEESNTRLVLKDQNYKPVSTKPAAKPNSTKPAEKPHSTVSQSSQASMPLNQDAAPEKSDSTPVQIIMDKTPSPGKMKAGKKGKLTISWKKFKVTKKNKAVWSKIRTVEVQYSTDPSFQTDVTSRTVSKKKTKLTVKGLQKNTTYYVRVRYTNGAGSGSEWSSVKTITVRK